jgi:ATP-dependent Lon protease
MISAKPRPPLILGETRAYPVLPMRDIVVFPHMIAPLFVGRRKSILALEEVMRSGTFILLATQKNASDDEPATEAIYEIGTLASVLQLLKLPDGTVKVLVEGAQRAKVVKYTDCSEYHEAEAVALGDTMGERVEAKALARSVTNEFESYVKLNKKVPSEVVGVVQQIEDYAKLADTVASHLAVKIPDRQAILETTTVTERLEKVLDLGARSALDQHLDRAVGQLEQLQHARKRADLEDGTRRRVIVGRILLGREQDEGIGTHHLFERLDRLFASNEKRDDHVREDDKLTQRQYRISAGFAGDQRRLWLCASHGPRSLLLCPPPVTRGCGITVECRGGPGREHGRPRWAPVRQRVGTKPSPENFEAILRTLFRSHNRWRRVGPVSSKPENSSK